MIWRCRKLSQSASWLSTGAIEGFLSLEVDSERGAIQNCITILALAMRHNSANQSDTIPSRAVLDPLAVVDALGIAEGNKGKT